MLVCAVPSSSSRSKSRTKISVPKPKPNASSVMKFRRFVCAAAFERAEIFNDLSFGA